MKKIYLLFLLVTLLAGCKSDSLPSIDDISTGEVVITLTGLDSQAADFTVQLRNMQTNSIFTAQTNAEGTAVFRTTPGLYEASATGGYASEGVAYNFNGTSGQITVRTNQTHHAHMLSCNPMDCSPLALLSMDFSRQEYWTKHFLRD